MYQMLFSISKEGKGRKKAVLGVERLISLSFCLRRKLQNTHFAFLPFLKSIDSLPLCSYSPFVVFRVIIFIQRIQFTCQ